MWRHSSPIIFLQNSRLSRWIDPAASKRTFMVSWILRKVLGSKNQREVKRIRPLTEKINRLEQEYQALTEDQLREKTAQWKKDLANIDDPDELARRLRAILPEAFVLFKNGA